MDPLIDLHLPIAGVRNEILRFVRAYVKPNDLVWCNNATWKNRIWWLARAVAYNVEADHIQVVALGGDSEPIFPHDWLAVCWKCNQLNQFVWESEFAHIFLTGGAINCKLGTYRPTEPRFVRNILDAGMPYQVGTWYEGTRPVCGCCD